MLFVTMGIFRGTYTKCLLQTVRAFWLRYTLKYKNIYQILLFDRKYLSLKAVFKVKKYIFLNANLVLEIFQVKVLPEVNKQVGVFLEINFNTTCGYMKSYRVDQFFLPIATKYGSMIVYIMNSKTLSGNL